MVDPGGAPPNTLFVPEAARPEVLSEAILHLGLARTLHLLWFWWPRWDTKNFAGACPVCTRGKSSHLAPAGLLQKLETGDLLMQYVFHLHGLPRDIVSDRGPWYTSRVWRSFCAALSTSVSHSSGYHSQSNGQTERMNQSLENALRGVAARHHSTWSTYLP